MSLKEVARQTLRICEEGRYTTEDGRTVVLADAVRAAVEGTELLVPRALEALVRASAWPAATGPTVVAVTDETTQVASHRLFREGRRDVMALNFASAKNPGGGFLGGARAQEEDLARCSALYPCLIAQRAYYDANRANGSTLYTDHMIYSPRVPFFRLRGRDAPLDEPYEVSVLTAPAPNTGALRGREDARRIPEVFERRARYVLAVAAARGHRTLVLGAWGCGAFQGDPVLVADVFGRLLDEPVGATFERVVFAVFDPHRGQRNLTAFRARLGA